MLKRLELLGFKSFADKTTFEFGSGITCVVGPNGSGKSNVVDSIKWVLGEQSAKSLRGKEMADVIFNGSATRRSLGLAEATLVFDNRRRLLPVDTDEVQITRRVYRSGEGEYLINKNAARLKDFRDLFMGTGAGTEAYSVIEQGKVDVLLQSSTKDRRAIFEEAAGISRFKSRKLEALRKLEHVAQNLLRVTDIVEEVEKQLRSVKLQAAKARRYQEHSERLRELRLQIGLADYHSFTLQLSEVEKTTATLQEDTVAQSTRCDSVDAKLLQVQSLTEELDNEVRKHEGTLNDVRQEIARLESQIAYERAHARDLVGQLDRLSHQWTEFFRRASELEKHIKTISAEVARVDAECAASRSVVEAEAASLDELRGTVEAQRDRAGEAQARFMELMHAGNQLHNELAALDSQEKTLRGQRQRLAARSATIESPLQKLAGEIAQLEDEQRQHEGTRDTLRSELAQLGSELERIGKLEEQTSEQLAAAREQRSAISASIELLEDMQRRHEGVGSGVQAALASPQLEPHRLGLVADLLEVAIEHAPLIERALGDRAQHVVVRDQMAAVTWLATLDAPPQGIVSLLSLDALRSSQESVASTFASQPGFLHIASSLVQTAPELAALADHLLGQTIIVRDLRTATSMARSAPPGVRFLTSAGELVDSEGTITAGDSQAAGGLVSRKSQLRALQEQVQAIDLQLTTHTASLDEHARMIERLESERRQKDEQFADTAHRIGELRNQLGQRRQQLTGLEEEVSLHRGEIAAIDTELTEIATQSATLRTRLNDTEQERQGLESLVRDLNAEIEEQQAEVETRQEHLTANQIELAKTEGQLAGLGQRLSALEAELEERRKVQSETKNEIVAARQKQANCQRKILAASSQIAGLYLRKEQIAREVVKIIQRRDDYRTQRQLLSSESQSGREKLQQLQADLHQRELEANNMRHQRSTLADRLREDYELELAAMYEGYQPNESLDRDATQTEIQELRRKIAGLGNVNLEALQELQELETRAATLQAQLEDLNQSKATLDEIIRKMNQDSQRLFMETLETIRGHFGELFRKLFGGGRADIVLENETDVLESGIEIVARPPGKELRSLSLLSGGEKTLTTVALLLAVFRSRPSPFCILDEVDAALDEANIERFTNLLRDFSQDAQFIMITHSKKSMVCADVLYGITMQESGVSKRVSVRFEDVNEHGEISEAALERGENQQMAPPAQDEKEAAA